MLTQEDLCKLLLYNPETGRWKWLIKRSSRCKDGWFYGYKSKLNTYDINLNHKLYKAHQLAYLYVYGFIPKEIDHINGNPLDNRIENLRAVSHLQNMQNITKPTIRNKTGFLGVVKQKDKYLAYIKANNVNYYLGSYSTPELAHEAYLKGKEKYHSQLIGR